jgi:dienelactone hydrolase
MIMGLLVLGGCASHAPPRVDDTLVRQFAAQGYAAVASEAATTTSTTLVIGTRNVPVVLTRPEHAELRPAVIYLPGLGEASEAGMHWRSAWATAGYAVLSVQLLDEDARAWTSELARASEFKTLGRQRYGAAATRERVSTLADLLAELGRRARAGEAPWQGIHWDRPALAGYDLGAYTAMVVAGERLVDGSTAPGRPSVAAAIVLSPYASLATGGAATRYSDIGVPVLSITSDTDGDPVGLVDAVSLRAAPFGHMAGPDKFLLTLQGLSHASLSGDAANLATRSENGKSQRSRAAADPTEGDSSGSGGTRHKGGRRGGAGGNSGAAESDGSAAGQGAVGDTGRSERVGALSPTELQKRLIAVQEVSVAFLDATVKNDKLARSWLTDNAGRWLGNGATWLHK